MPAETSTAAVLGAKYSATLAAFLGSLVALSYVKELTKTQVLLAVFIGVVFSEYTTPMAMHLLGLPKDINDGVAFILGLLAMNIIPLAQATLEATQKQIVPILKKLIEKFLP